MGLLDGKTALVTGCSRGIGYAVMRRYVEEGAVVYANARMSGSLDHALNSETGSLESNGACSGKMIPVYFDIRDKAGIKECMMRIRKEQGSLDILVNNAGVMQDAWINMINDETMNMTFDINVFSMIHVTQMALKIMRNGNAGSIINLSSIVGLRGSAGQSVYAASKGAVAALTKTWARELVSSNIRVNGLAPGKIDTDMFRSIGEERVAEQIQEVGMGRLGTSKEVADVAVFLGSDMSSYVTGEIIGVNGGWFL